MWLTSWPPRIYICLYSVPVNILWALLKLSFFFKVIRTCQTTGVKFKTLKNCKTSLQGIKSNNYAIYIAFIRIKF